MVTSVVEAVTRDLLELGKRDASIPESGMAALALALALEIDDRNSATSKSMCARVLMDALKELAEQAAPEEKTGGKVDELQRRRAEKMGAAGA